MNKTGHRIGTGSQTAFEPIFWSAQAHLGIVHVDALHEQPEIALARQEIGAEKLFADGGAEGRKLGGRERARRRAPLMRRSFGLGAGTPLNEMSVTAGTRQTLIPDVQGSIAARLPSASGVPVKLGYQPFGEHPGLTGTYRYTAQRLDPETSGSTSQPSGLYYYQARMYSPTWGRFLQPDPVGYQAGANLYVYVGNDPLNLTDPTGLCFLGCFWKSPIFRDVVAIAAVVTLQYEVLPEVEAAAFAESTAEIAASTTATVANAAIAGAAGGAIQGGTLRSALAGALADVAGTELAGPLGSDLGRATGNIVSGVAAGAVGGAIEGGTLKSTLTGAVVGGVAAAAFDLGQEAYNQYEQAPSISTGNGETPTQTAEVIFNTSHYIGRVGAGNIGAVEGMAGGIIGSPGFAGPGASLCFVCNGVPYQMRTFEYPGPGDVFVGSIFPIR